MFIRPRRQDRVRQCSSARLEHSPCKRRVGGSKPPIGFSLQAGSRRCAPQRPGRIRRPASPAPRPFPAHPLHPARAATGRRLNTRIDARRRRPSSAPAARRQARALRRRDARARGPARRRRRPAREQRGAIIPLLPCADRRRPFGTPMCRGGRARAGQGAWPRSCMPAPRRCLDARDHDGRAEGPGRRASARLRIRHLKDGPARSPAPTTPQGGPAGARPDQRRGEARGGRQAGAAGHGPRARGAAARQGRRQRAEPGGAPKKARSRPPLRVY